MKTIRLAGATVELHDNPLTVTVYPEGEVPAYPQATDGYKAQARELGYDDVAVMSRHHELAHSLLAAWLEQPHSHTLRALASGKEWEHWRLEEAAVLAIQALATRLGIDLQAVAERLAAS